MHNSSILPWAAMRTNEATYVEHFCICKRQPFLPTTTAASSTAPEEAAERVKPSAWNTTSDPYNHAALGCYIMSLNLPVLPWERRHPNLLKAKPGSMWRVLG